MSKAIQEIVADLRKADMSGAQVDAGHVADQIALACVELEDKWRREREDIEADGIAKGINGHAEVCMKHGFYDNEPVGNAAALLKALRALRDASRNFYNQILNSKYSGILDKYTCVKQGFPAVLDLRAAIPMANYALSAPARQCDVGTADEQYIRHKKFCGRYFYRGPCRKCPVGGSLDCRFAWAQTPYEAQEGAGK